MAAQYTAIQMRAAWDAAVAAYATLRGTSEADMMDSGVDMTSADITGLWDLVDAASWEDLNPNNRTQATFTDGTSFMTFTYDELASHDTTGVYAKFDAYFGPHLKIWATLLSIQAAVEAVAIGATLTMPIPGALWDWEDYRDLIAALAGSAGRLEFSGLTSGLNSDALGAVEVFPAAIS